MLRIRTKVAKSTVDGLGLFADEFIPKGTTTWKYDPPYDVGFTQEQVDTLPSLAREHVLYYCYRDYDLNLYILCADGQRFINHSLKRMNIHSEVERDVAARDIQPGEELLCDYGKFDAHYFERHGLRPEDLKD